MTDRPKITIAVDPAFVELVKLCLALKFGEIRVVIQGGLPTRADMAVKQVKLDIPGAADQAMKELETLDIG